MEARGQLRAEAMQNAGMLRVVHDPVTSWPESQTDIAARNGMAKVPPETIKRMVETLCHAA